MRPMPLFALAAVTAGLAACATPWVQPGTTYVIDVTRAEGDRIAGTLDGEAVLSADGALRVPLRFDGGTHRVDVVLGRDVAPVYAPREKEGLTQS